jgi:hypothetical protein
VDRTYLCALAFVEKAALALVVEYGRRSGVGVAGGVGSRSAVHGR